MQEFVILVDEHNNEIGLMEKLEAHQKALLHRAFSIFILNSKGELLLQQRALNKYHSGGLWTNTCCSHPRANEQTIDAAHRRLKEEMGFDCELTEKFSFLYKAPFDNGLTEHELDFIFVGEFNDVPNINPEEVNDYTWMMIDDVLSDLKQFPNKYTEWFKIILNQIFNHVLSYFIPLK
jgi:isopentenyl-diphosphate delta-isomerase